MERSSEKKSFTPKKTTGAHGIALEGPTLKNEYLMSLGEGTLVKVCRYKGQNYINIRDYAGARKEGYLQAKKRGLMLSEAQFRTLNKYFKVIDKELKQNVKLSN